ncbi:MAG: transposase [Desulfotalea sp.]
MSKYTEQDCPECGQSLRFPNHVGGVTMQCPNCGQKFYSDFKIGKVGKQKINISNYSSNSNGQNTPRIFIDLFEMPYKIFQKISKALKGK